VSSEKRLVPFQSGKFTQGRRSKTRSRQSQKKDPVSPSFKGKSVISAKERKPLDGKERGEFCG